MNQKEIEQITKALTDCGKLIEAGFISLKIMSLPTDIPQWQIDQLRSFFFAGAQHLFSSIMSFLEAGQEPTDKDMIRFTLVQKELDNFIKDFELHHTPTSGTA